ncbi:MAG: hypothetical protein IT292_07105 [Deltaproteobacteria bacterium]|nr:hypothetical protein [Deltaproteobacteria bacterium]
MMEALTLEQGSVLVKTKFLKYFALSKINYFNRSAYLTNLFCSAAVIVLRIWIFTQLFRASYSSAGVGSIGGLSVGAAIWSLMLTQSFSSALRPSVMTTIEEEVKNGSLAYSII